MRLRGRIDMLLDERWQRNKQIDDLLGTVRDLERELAHFTERNRTARERRLRDAIVDLRKRSQYWYRQAYRLRRQRDMWRQRAMLSHEERLAQQRDYRDEKRRTA